MDRTYHVFKCDRGNYTLFQSRLWCMPIKIDFLCDPVKNVRKRSFYEHTIFNNLKIHSWGTKSVYSQLHCNQKKKEDI